MQPAVTGSKQVVHIPNLIKFFLLPDSSNRHNLEERLVRIPHGWFTCCELMSSGKGGCGSGRDSRSLQITDEAAQCVCVTEIRVVKYHFNTKGKIKE